MNRQSPRNEASWQRSIDPVELLTPAEAGEADRLTIAAGVSGKALMEAAGAAVAAAVRRRWRGGGILVLAGPGNNGGDGWVAARLLRDVGYRITLALFGDRDRLSGDAATAAGKFDGVVAAADPTLIAGAGLIVDALFGAGVRLPLSPEAAALVEAVNGSGATVVSVDLPSGVEGEGGTTGGPAVRADETVTFFRFKPGHFLLPGNTLCGDLGLVQIGIEADVLKSIRPSTFRNSPSLWTTDLPVRSAADHKYDRGHALVVSGPPSATGAARMAAEAALRIGAGLVTLASPPASIQINAAHLTAIVLRRFEGPEGLRVLLEDRRFNALALGPGLGASEETARLVETVLRAGRATVLDADALTSFEEQPARLFEAIARSAGDVVLTPHEGEFGRLFPDITATSKLARTREASSRSGAVILLKGADTVVAAPDGWAAINDNAPPFLATAGAGDVLAGMIAGLLAQGMPARLAASAAAWMHGRAAVLAGPAMIATDLPPLLASVLRELAPGGV